MLSNLTKSIQKKGSLYQNTFTAALEKSPALPEVLPREIINLYNSDREQAINLLKEESIENIRAVAYPIPGTNFFGNLFHHAIIANAQDLLNLLLAKTLETDNSSILDHPVIQHENDRATVIPTLLFALREQNHYIVEKLLQTGKINLWDRETIVSTENNTLITPNILEELLSSKLYNSKSIKPYLNLNFAPPGEIIYLYKFNNALLRELFREQQLNMWSFSQIQNTFYFGNLLHHTIEAKIHDLFDELVTQCSDHYSLNATVSQYENNNHIYVPSLLFAMKVDNDYAVLQLLQTGKIDLFAREAVFIDENCFYRDSILEIIIKSGKYNWAQIKPNFSDFTPYHLQVLISILSEAPDTKHPIHDHLLQLVFSTRYDVLKEDIEYLLSKTAGSGIPFFNVNLRDSEGKRIIDHATEQDLEFDIINLLRRTGSVEPQIPVSFVRAEKLDLSKGKLDEYGPNRVNIVKITELMLQYCHLSPKMADDIIESFKEKVRGIESFPDIEWGNNVNTVEAIADAIVTEMGDHMQDRIAGAVNCKQVLASIIHIVNLNAHIETSHPANPGIILPLDKLFIATLCSLKMCNLGKLINLVALVQDIVLASPAGRIDYEEVKSKPLIYKLLVKTAEELEMKFGKHAGEASVRWALDIYQENLKPDNWHPFTQAIHGLFNDGIIALADSIESYHFTIISDKILREFAAELVPLRHNNFNILIKEYPLWVAMIRNGVNTIAGDFFHQVAEAFLNNSEINKYFDEVISSKHLLFGDFSVVNKEVITETLLILSQADRIKFLSLLQENCELPDENQISNFLQEKQHFEATENEENELGSPPQDYDAVVLGELVTE